MLAFLLQYVWPVVVGISLGIFSFTTHSWIIAATFYIFTLCYNWKVLGSSIFTSSPDYIINTTMAKAAIVGLLVIALCLILTFLEILDSIIVL